MGLTSLMGPAVRAGAPHASHAAEIANRFVAEATKALDAVIGWPTILEWTRSLVPWSGTAVE